MIEADASGTGVGAVLMQEGRPIAFFSKKMGQRMRSSSTYNKELYAITEAVQKWRQYLLGRSFIIRTDQKSIKELLQQTILTPEQQHHVRKLMGYSFSIEYKMGSSNKVADALSRRESDDSASSAIMTLATSFPVTSFTEELKRENTELGDMVQLHRKFATGELSADYTVRDGLLFYKKRLYISPSSLLRERILHECHSSPMAGHGGIKRTLMRISASFFWPGLRKDVELYVSRCVVCQQIKVSTQPPAGLIQPLPIPSQVWEDITMDFITGLPNYQGNTVILVVVDRLSKYAHFAALPTQFTAAKVAGVFVQLIVKLHGIPRTIISDRDPVFLSHFWTELFALSGTKLLHSTAYHPQTDGQTEVVNRGIAQYLRAFVADRPKLWGHFLCWAEYNYNTSFHSGLLMSPYQALYGRPPPPVLAYQNGATSIQALEEELMTRDEVLRELKENLLQAQNRMQQQANRKRRDVEFRVGDLVLVKLQPYRQFSVARRGFQKLAKKYFGPFPVEERIGSVAYRLALPEGSKIHPVFHVSLLRPFQGPVGTASDLPLDDVEGKPILVPAAIYDTKVVLHQGQPATMVLVRWKGLPSEESTWEFADEMLALYPDLHLEDKVVFPAGGDDTTGAHEFAEALTSSVKPGEESIARRKPVRDRRVPARLRN